MRAKKSLGQNFLKSQSALRKIIEVGELKSGDIVLEIGPGRGVLTQKLLEGAGKVLAVEKDWELFEFLKSRFSKEVEENKLILEEEDILRFDISRYVSGNSKYKIIANIPYNITGAILKKFLTAENQPELMVLLLQQEVASRILARNHKESILSISVKAYGQPKLVTKVDRRYFSPVPQVDSAVILIKNISRKFFTENGINERKFWEIVRKGFAHKRKRVAGNLKNVAEDRFLAGFGDKRAEDLSISDWILLAQ